MEDAILEPIENAFDAVGMMQGETAPLKRAAVGAGIGYFVGYYLQPSIAWNAGVERVWTPLAKDTAEYEDSTWLPAWMITAIPAFVFGVLI